MAILFWLSLFIVFYTYLGYPALIWVLAQGKKDPEYSPDFFPTVSLVIPAYNEEVVIEKKIENSLELEYPSDKLQILVAADGSDDGTPELVRKFEDQGVDLNYDPKRAGKLAAMTRALARCTGEIVVFSDANTMYQPDSVSKLVLPFQDPTVGSTTGAKIIIEDKKNLSASEGLYWKYESGIKISENRLGSSIAAVGEMTAVRKKLFKPAPADTINDDRYIVATILKQGYKNIYVPEAKSLEYASGTAREEIVRRRRMSAGGYQFIARSKDWLPFNRPMDVWKLVSHKYSRLVVPFALILTFLTNVYLGLRQVIADGNWLGLYSVLLVLQILFYLAGLLGKFVKLPGKLGKLLYLPTFLINSNYAIFMGFFTYLGSANLHLWEKAEREEFPE